MIQAMASDPADSRLYALNYKDQTASAIDLGSNAVTATISLPVLPTAGVVVGGKLYVVGDIPRTQQGEVVEIDTATNTVETTTLSIGRDPYEIVAVNGCAFVPNQSDSSVSVVDLSTNSVAKTVTAGIGEYPTGATVDPSTGYVYIANQVSNSISILGAQALQTPTVTVTPSLSIMSTAQDLSVGITVAGGNGNPIPTGSVTLTGGGYTSAAATLGGGSATIDIPAGSLATGSDTLTASYTPDAGSSSTYNSATGTAPVTVGTATPIIPYIEVNNGAWQNVAGVTVAYGSTANLGPQPLSGGSWSWTGPSGFSSNAREIDGIIPTAASSVYTATYTNAAGVTSTETFTITIAPTAIVPYIEVNGGAWQNVASVTVVYGSTVNLGPQPGSGGTWSWSGPGVTSSAREIDGIIPTAASSVYTASYTNPAGAISTLAFTITVAATPITPYIEVNGGAWQGTNSVTVPVGSAVNLGPQAAGSGTWSWSGPSYTASTRQVNNVPLTSANNVYTATFTNAAGVTSTETFTITIAPTTITPYLEVNGGAWQATNNIAVAPGSTVNLGPQAAGGGTWSWSGPGFTSSAQQVNNVPLTSASNVYTATFTNAAGVISTETFTITVAPTAITPYLEVNGGAWQATNSVTVAAGSSVNLGPQASGSGTWSWSGPSFTASTSQVNNVPLTSASNVYTATFTNAAGVRSTETFTITIAPTTITPYLQDYEQDGGAWQATANLTANYSDTVNLGPQAAGSGTWSWSGPGFTSSAQQVNNIPLNSPSNVYTASFTNAAGVISTETFTITVAPTTITPYIEVNNGAWQGTNSVTVAAGSTVNLGPQPGSGGSWSWAGPNGYEAGSRQINGIPLSVGSNSYVATYTNPAGVTSTETFTITVE
jgi:YVTN family beta-propeller protein